MAGASATVRLVRHASVAALVLLAGCQSTGSSSAVAKAKPQRISHPDPLLSAMISAEEKKSGGGSTKATSAPKSSSNRSSEQSRADQPESPFRATSSQTPLPGTALELQAPRWVPAESSSSYRVNLTGGGLPPASGGVVLSFDQGQELLKRLGGDECRVQRDGTGWVCSCLVKRDGQPGRRYVGRDPNYLGAMQSVLEQIERDRND